MTNSIDTHWVVARWDKDHAVYSNEGVFHSEEIALDRLLCGFPNDTEVILQAWRETMLLDKHCYVKSNGKWIRE
jgi:hypothetical protein